MAGAGAPEGLPLNFRFSPDLSGQDSPTLQWGTLILVTPTNAGVMRCLFRIQMFGLHLRFAKIWPDYTRKKMPRISGASFFLILPYLWCICGCGRPRRGMCRRVRRRGIRACICYCWCARPRGCVRWHNGCVGRRICARIRWRNERWCTRIRACIRWRNGRWCARNRWCVSAAWYKGERWRRGSGRCIGLCARWRARWCVRRREGSGGREGSGWREGSGRRQGLCARSGGGVGGCNGRCGGVGEYKGPHYLV